MTRASSTQRNITLPKPLLDEVRHRADLEERSVSAQLRVMIRSSWASGARGGAGDEALTAPVSVYLPETLAETLDREAERLSVPLSGLVLSLVAGAIRPAARPRLQVAS